MKPWLRWILVLPAAIGSLAGIEAILLIASLIPHILPDIFIQILSCLICPIAFVTGGAKTAPSHRGATAICLTIIYAIVEGILLTIIIVTKAEGGWRLVWLGVCSVLGIAAGVKICHNFQKNEALE